MITDDIEVSAAEFARRKRESSHWLKLSDALYKSKDEHELLTMLKVELEGLDRPYVLSRVYSHFNVVRRHREKDEIKAWRAAYAKTVLDKGK